MMALLHFPWWGAPPAGIWWFDGSATLSSYYPDYPELAIVGGHALRHVRYTADAHDLPAFFTYMAERRPCPDHWETVMLTYGMDPKRVLDRFRLTGFDTWQPGPEYG